MSELENILADIESVEAGAATRLAWNPSRVGDIDIHITADGSWYHEGRRFQRATLVKLFASVLRREQDDYFLVTPAEKLRIRVDDVPFVATLVETFDDDGQQAIVFTTNIEERIIVDAEHPIRVEIDRDSGEPRPYVLLRHGLEALISRSAFYDLLCLADERALDDGTYLIVRSRGHEFVLGRADA